MLSSFPDDSSVLVQGASRGIGLEFVRQLLAESRAGRVFACCRTPAAARELAALSAQEPRLRVVALDATDEHSIARARIKWPLRRTGCS